MKPSVAADADARHHHAIDAYHGDVREEPVTTIGRRPTCFECGSSSGAVEPAGS